MEATSAARPRGFRIPKPRRLLAALADDRLVEQFRHGEDAAFEVLYDRHSPGVLGFCRHMLRSQQDAEDVVQHAFIAAHADLLRDTERHIHFKAWLYTISRNRCLSILRARREHPAEELELATEGLSDDVQQRDDLRAMLADIHKLPDDQREALVLSELGDLSHAEVAEVVGCEVSKVKSLVFQARNALIDRRRARDTSCEEIQREIATLRGGALRRSHLRHHIESCPGCAQYREEVRRQRQMLALALPVVPTALMRGDVLAAVGVGGGAAATGAAATGTGVAVAAKSGLAKIGVIALIAGGTAGTAVVAHNTTLPVIGGDSSTPSKQEGQGESSQPAPLPGTAAPAGINPNGKDPAAKGKSDATKQDAKDKKKSSHTRSESGTAHGFTPTQGESNGARAREFAKTRGQGKHTGLSKTRSTPVRKRARPVHVKKTPPAPTRTSPTTSAPKTNSAPTSRSAPEPQQQPAPAQTQTQAPTTTSPTATVPKQTTRTTLKGVGNAGAN